MGTLKNMNLEFFKKADNILCLVVLLKSKVNSGRLGLHYYHTPLKYRMDGKKCLMAYFFCGQVCTSICVLCIHDGSNNCSQFQKQ